MKSYMQIEQDHDGVKFMGVIRWDEWPKLDPMDSALIWDCGGKDRKAADWLLALEVLFRRAHEQFAAQDVSRKEDAR